MPDSPPEKDAFTKALTQITSLVEAFRAGEDYYRSFGYSELQTRTDFIDKFWIALGWDVNHHVQINPYEQDVKVERNPSGDFARGRRADYAFFASNFRDVRFFVEAKRPGSDLSNPTDCFQVARYGWSSRAPLSVLMSFEHFRVLDCRYKPSIETAAGQVIADLSFHYTEYADPERFKLIYFLFARECVLNSSIEKYVAGLKKPTGRARQRGLFPSGRAQQVDDVFLQELDEHREALARSFKRENPELDGESLTELTQRTLDRLVFMRFLEDKLIEPEAIVERLGDRGPAWRDFVSESRRFDGLYNGIIFKHHSVLDSSSFRVDEEVFAEIREKLAHTNSPYAFNYIPIHILGSIYERFLGKVIVATARQARLEPKPEVRKAGGVYYTPEYIVRYIVENTVGKLIAGKTPEQIHDLRFADIACGSGSFLLGIFDCLLRYHTTYFNNGRKAAPKAAGCVLGEDGKWHLSLRQKRELLLNNIYGVDIDHQAVEVAQLSLFLKLLEEENISTAKHYQLEFHEALLPDLSKNIVCGNSLIGWDILDGKLFDTDQEKKLNPMDFDAAFPDIMRQGGFDAILGNPPYVRIQGFPRNQIEYLSQHYVAATGNYDLYVNFVERAVSLLTPNGRFGYILPNKFMKTDYGVGLRGLISSGHVLSGVVDFGASQVFPATTYTCLLFLAKRDCPDFSVATAQANEISLNAATPELLHANQISKAPWSFEKEEEARLDAKLQTGSLRIFEIAEMSRGTSTGDDNSFMVSDSGGIEKAILRIPLFATDFHRYEFHLDESRRLIFPYSIESGEAHLIGEHELEKDFPKAWKHLRLRQTALKKRKQFTAWYGFSAPRNLALHDIADIAVPLLADRGLCALIPKSVSGRLCPMASGGFTLAIVNPSFDKRYVLSVLNSKLMFWNLRRISNVFRGGWITCTKQYFGQLPIRRPDSDRNQNLHAELALTADRIIEAKKRLNRAKTERERTLYQNKCAALDHQIDQLVYQLYELTPAEIALVESSSAAAPARRTRTARASSLL